MTKTAILVDGNYYLRRARVLWGDKSPLDRVSELHEYALKHIGFACDGCVESEPRSLYRLFFYDCPPLQNVNVWQPWDGKNRCFNSKDPEYLWKTEFLNKLSLMRKAALRLGEITVGGLHYAMREQAIKDVVNGRRSVSDLTKKDYRLVGMKQSGVDMRIGLDVASMASSGVVDQIVLIAGDADFVPAVKLARRSGIDFLIDPMGNTNIRNEFVAQSDGVEDASGILPLL